MSRRLGSLFLTAALGPLHYAGQCIMARRVDDGLRQLTGEDVFLAFHRGMTAVAKEVGVGLADVTALLPVAEMQAIAAQIGAHQQSALAQWHLHTGDTGLLDGVADLTVDGRAPDASLCLLRLSAKMRLDKQLATPLRQLSEDLDRWQQMLDACRILIDDGAALEKAYRQRRLVRLGLAIAALLGLSAAIVWLVRVSLAQGRIDDALAANDPCEMAIDEADRAKASDAQETALAAKSAACEEQHEVARRAEEAARREREAARVAAAESAAREARCEVIAKVASGASSKSDLDGEAKALVARIGRRALEPADLEIAVARIPCGESRAFPALAGAYVTAALSSLGVWMYASTLSDGAVTLFSRGKGALSEEERVNFAQHAEHYAEKALVTGDEAKVARAQGLCRAAEAIDQPLRQYCRSLLTVSAP